MPNWNVKVKFSWAWDSNWKGEKRDQKRSDREYRNTGTSTPNLMSKKSRVTSTKPHMNFGTGRKTTEPNPEWCDWSSNNLNHKCTRNISAVVLSSKANNGTVGVSAKSATLKRLCTSALLPQLYRSLETASSICLASASGIATTYALPSLSSIGVLRAPSSFFTLYLVFSR